PRCAARSAPHAYRRPPSSARGAPRSSKSEADASAPTAEDDGYDVAVVIRARRVASARSAAALQPPAVETREFSANGAKRDGMGLHFSRPNPDRQCAKPRLRDPRG